MLWTLKFLVSLSFCTQPLDFFFFFTFLSLVSYTLVGLEPTTSLSIPLLWEKELLAEL